MRDPLDTLPSWTGHPTLGWQLAEWAATRFIVPDGPGAGEYLELSDRQLLFILHWYAVDAQGGFLHHGATMRHARGSGKALALDTPLPTPSGWTSMGEVSEGDLLLDEYGHPTEVTAVTEVMHEHDCYRVSFSDGTSTTADAEHLWPVQRFTEGGYVDDLASTEQLAEEGLSYDLGQARWASMDSPLLQWDVGQSRWVIPEVPPQEMETDQQTGPRTIIEVEPVDSVPVRCVSVSGPSSLYLAGEGMVPTHNSPLMAFLACCELVGPVRFGGWAEDGDPIGVPVSMPLVQLAAVALDQTSNVMRYCQAWLGKGSPLQVEYGLDPGKQIIYAPGHGNAAGGSLRVITSSAATVRGARPTAVFADEVGEWTERNGGQQFRARIGENTAKVTGSRVIESSNVWTPGGGSVAERRWEAWHEATEAGNDSYLMDVREAPADVDWSDAEHIRTALRSVYEPSPWVDPDDYLPTILDPFKPIEESQREFGNLRVSDLSSWVSAQWWDACADIEASLQDGDPVALFCDPSETDDTTALVACRITDGLVSLEWAHEPNAIAATGQPYGPVDPAELDRHVQLTADRFEVCAFFSDVRPMEQLSKDTWKNRYGDQLMAWATRKDPVAFDMRDRWREFAQAAELVAAQIKQGKLLHNGDHLLSRHVRNAERNPIGQHVSVRKPEQARKIDAAVAMIGARLARERVLESKAWANRERRGQRKVLVWR